MLHNLLARYPHLSLRLDEARTSSGRRYAAPDAGSLLSIQAIRPFDSEVDGRALVK